MDGLYGKPLAWPEVDPEFTLNIIPEMEDLIVHVTDDDCSRFNEILGTVEADSDVAAMMDQIDADLETTLFPELRIITNMTDASTEDMHDVCNYIYWAHVNYVELSFTLTEDQKNQCNVSYQRKVFKKFDASYELIYQPTFEYLETLLEFA